MPRGPGQNLSRGVIWGGDRILRLFRRPLVTIGDPVQPSLVKDRTAWSNPPEPARGAGSKQRSIKGDRGVGLVRPKGEGV